MKPKAPRGFPPPRMDLPPKGYALIKRGTVKCGDLIWIDRDPPRGGWQKATSEWHGIPTDRFFGIARRSGRGGRR